MYYVMLNILCSHIQMDIFQNDKSYANRRGIKTNKMKAGSMRKREHKYFNGARCGAKKY